MVILVAFEVSLVVSALGIVSGLLKKRQSIIGLFVVTFLSILVMWYSYAIDLPMSILFDDICYTVNDYVDNGVGNYYKHSFHSFFKITLVLFHTFCSVWIAEVGLALETVSLVELLIFSTKLIKLLLNMEYHFLRPTIQQEL